MTPCLALRHIDKSFGGAVALRGAEMEVTAPGVGHALVGANGSGKSTLLGILSGQTFPDRGVVEIGGEAVTLSSPSVALQRGIAMVAQETAVAPDLTVAENIFLGRRMRRRRSGIDWSATVRAATEAMAPLDAGIDVTARVRDLRPDQQQIVEIARALSMDCRVLILDEPTSSLTEDEVATVCAAVRRIKALGVAVILVSHRFEEIFALCEEVTVLRDGRTVGQGSLDDHDPNSLVDLMIGSAQAGATIPSGPPTTSPGAVPVLRLNAVSSPRAVSNIELSVAPGEIVGLAGLVGSGRNELLEAIFGLRPSSGDIFVGGQPLPSETPRRLIDRGVGYVPPDRKGQGLVLSQSVTDNLTMVSDRRHSRWRAPSRPQRLAAAAVLVADLGIRGASPDAPARTLSGGNQQKLVLGKWLQADIRVLLLDEPTRGVDVAAKADIHGLLRTLAGRGVALLVSSSEPSELLALCHRIIVMVRGRVVAGLTAEGLTEDVLASHAGGHL